MALVLFHGPEELSTVNCEPGARLRVDAVAEHRRGLEGVHKLVDICHIEAPAHHSVAPEQRPDSEEFTCGD